MRRLAAAFAVCLWPLAAPAQSGRELIEASLQRHALPSHIYEEQVLVITDRQGRQTVRTLRSYTLSDESGSHNVRIVETPAEARGTALHLGRDPDAAAKPAALQTSPAFGSAFTLADLEPETPRDFRYERERDQVLGRAMHHVVRAVPGDDAVARRTGYRERLIYLRKDNLFVSRIDYRDAGGRPIRRQTFRDPLPDEAGAWRPRMILMEDLRDGSSSLIKVERRVYSPDYVPAALFTGSRTDS